jgi:hypothetical protein
MRRTLLLAFMLALLLLPAERAQAQYRFGTDEEIHFIQDVPLKGAENEELYLGYMTRTRNFLLGYSVEDAGYVLGVKGGSKKFYHMPQGDDLARFQKAGTLPDPLPPYRLGFFDYVAGYSLWWGLGLVALFWAVGAWRKRRGAAGAAEQASPPA